MNIKVYEGGEKETVINIHDILIHHPCQNNDVVDYVIDNIHYLKNVIIDGLQNNGLYCFDIPDLYKISQNYSYELKEKIISIWSIFHGLVKKFLGIEGENYLLKDGTGGIRYKGYLWNA